MSNGFIENTDERVMHNLYKYKGFESKFCSTVSSLIELNTLKIVWDLGPGENLQPNWRCLSVRLGQFGMDFQSGYNNENQNIFCNKKKLV